MTARPPFVRRSCQVLIAAALLGAAACASEPSASTQKPAAFDGRLLVHTGRPEPIGLLALDGRGRESEVAVPVGGLRWFAAASDGRLAGVDGDGAILVSDGDGSDWRPILMDEVPLAAAAAEVRLPAWSPDGRLAVVFGDPEAASIAGVLVVDPATDGELWIDLAVGLGGYPPAWIDAGRLAVPTRVTGDRTVVTIVTVDEGTLGPAIGGARAVTASPDGSTLAVVDDDGSVEVWRPADWLAGAGGGPLERFRASAPGTVDAVALDATGDRLAIATSDPDGAAAGIVRVLDGTDGWATILERPMAAGAPVGALGFVR